LKSKSYIQGINAIGPYSPATVVGDTIYVSGQIPINYETGNIESQDI